MSNIQIEVKEQYEELKVSIRERLDDIKDLSKKDLSIDEFELDTALLQTPHLHGKWLSMYTDETINLKELYGLKERVKLERWKYYTGTQTNEYIAKNGILHEKILKSDVEKYLNADSKLSLVNDVVSMQKALTDYLEQTIREIRNRGFHIKSILDYRKFISGG